MCPLDDGGREHSSGEGWRKEEGRVVIFVLFYLYLKIDANIRIQICYAYNLRPTW